MRAAQYGKGKVPVAPDAGFALRGSCQPFTPAVHKVTVKKTTATMVVGSTNRLKVKVTRHTMINPMAKVRTEEPWALPVWGPHAVGLHGPNAALPTKRIRYLEAKTVVYSDGVRGAAVRLNLHSKSGYRGLKVEGQRKRRMPTATKRYAVAKK